MNKILSSPIWKVILMVLLVPALSLNFLMAYIIFVPNTFPKPFYLVYECSPGGAAVVENQEGAVVPQSTEEAPAEESQVVKPGQGIMYDTGTKIINLAEPNDPRYIWVNIVLEFMPSNPHYLEMEHEELNHYLEEFNHEIEDKLPIINDSLISMLSSKSFEDVYTTEGKELIRQEMVALLNEKLPSHQIMNVYFTEFVVQ